MIDTIKLADRIAGQRHMMAIHRGFKLNVPLFVIGAFAVMLENLPFPWYRSGMLFLLGPDWPLFWKFVANASLSGISILLSLATSYFLAETGRGNETARLHPLLPALVSLACLLALLQPFGPGSMNVAWAGVGGIFIALVVALSATELFLRLCAIRRLRINLTADIADPVLSQALTHMLPAMAAVFFFCLIRLGLTSLQIQDIQMYANLQIPGIFEGIESPLAKMMAYNLFVHIFWFFGVHGSNIMEPFLLQIRLIDLPASGQTWQMLTKTFQDVFVITGGAGSTFGLLLALLYGVRRGSLSWLLKLSVVPAAFNINEILLFGLPVILNPVFIIPFLIVPSAVLLLSYAAIQTGWVSPVVQPVHWTTPPLISGYLATQSWSGSILQLINILLAAALYLPFVRLNEKRRERQVVSAFAQAMEEAGAHIAPARKRLLDRQDGVGLLARRLAADLKKALAANELFLEYQPQVNDRGRVFGMEALLRWTHASYGRIPPPLIVAVAEEEGLIRDVGDWVLAAACRQMREWKAMGIEDIRISVNVSAIQLQDPDFPARVLTAMKRYEVRPENIELEITETIALNNDARTNENLNILRQAAVRIAIDDFGMGHTSLRYLKNYPVDTLKIDRIISKDVADDRNCQEIISSIVLLCSSLGIDIVVEYVETERQRDSLKQLGCLQYQGYYYSAPLSAAQAYGYIMQNNAKAAAAGTIEA